MVGKVEMGGKLSTGDVPGENCVSHRDCLYIGGGDDLGV